MTRIGIIGLLHESNTFIAQPTTIENFQQHVIVTGEKIREQHEQTHHEIGGFFEGLHRYSEETANTQPLTAVPIFLARTLPSGPLTASTFEQLVTQMLDELKEAGQLDGILVAPHGATVCETFPDADGEWLARLRNQVGPDVPIIGTLDLHTNLSPKMIQSCNAFVAYRTNPHLDQRARGIEAARLMARTLAGEIRPTMAAVFPPLAINIERQATDEDDLKPLYDFADEQLSESSILSNSILLGFPYSDVHEMGSAVLVVTNNNEQLATTSARELASVMWERRENFVGNMIDIDSALDQCATLEGPICLLDMGDNVGGGSSADGTFLAHAIHQREIDLAFVCLFDPESVKQAELAGVNAAVRLSVGGKSDDLHGPPLELDCVVQSLHDGRFSESEPRHGGFSTFDQGPTAIVKAQTGLTVMLTSRRMVPFSLHQLFSCDLDPTDFHILVAKGVNAPIAAYGPICRNIIRVNTAGSTCADMLALEYTHRRRPMFPFEPDTNWSSDEPTSVALGYQTS